MRASICYRGALYTIRSNFSYARGTISEGNSLYEGRWGADSSDPEESVPSMNEIDRLSEPSALTVAPFLLVESSFWYTDVQSRHLQWR